MAGHSKWKNIRIKKGRVDEKRGKAFTKLSKEILVAARAGGADPEANYRLKDAIARAKAESMPKDNIDRLLEKARGGGEGSEVEELTYEGYGPAGVAILVEAATDNRNRTASEMRLFFSKGGGALGESGSVAWQFERRGLISIPTTAPTGKKGAPEPIDEEALLMAALEAGALDMETQDDIFAIYTEPTDLHQVREGLADFIITSAGFTMLPKNTVTIGAEEAPAVLKLMGQLEDHDDVQNVYANFDIPAEVMETLEA